MNESQDKQLSPNDTPIGIKEMSSGALAIYVPAEQVESFKHLVQRAMHTWERAPISILEFADYLIEGKLVQDYRNLTVYKRNQEYGNQNAHGQQNPAGIGI